MWYFLVILHARTQSLVRGGLTLAIDNVFFFVFCFFYEGRNDPYTTINGPLLARQQNAIFAFRWRVDDGPTLNAGLKGDPSWSTVCDCGVPAHIPCADPESFVRGGPTLTTVFFFLVDEERDDPNTTISGPSLAFCWRADDGPALNAGLKALCFHYC